MRITMLSMKCELARLALAELQIDPWLEDDTADWKNCVVAMLLIATVSSLEHSLPSSPEALPLQPQVMPTLSSPLLHCRCGSHTTYGRQAMN